VLKSSSLLKPSTAERLKRVNLYSLEVRHLHADLFYCYKRLFGLVDLQASDFFEWAPCKFKTLAATSLNCTRTVTVVLWSTHYKHLRSRQWLVTPPNEGPWIAVLLCTMDLLTLSPDPLTLTFDQSNLKAYYLNLLRVYPKVIPYTKFEYFGIIRFWVMLQTNRQTDKQTNKQTNKQTAKQTDSKILPTPTDIVSVGN